MKVFVSVRPRWLPLLLLAPLGTYANSLPAEAPVGVLNPTTAVASALTNEEIFEGWGWLTARRFDLAGIELRDDELALFLQGLESSLGLGAAPADPHAFSPNLEKLAAQRRLKPFLARKRTEEEKARTFFTHLEGNPQVKKLNKSLFFDVIKEGRGPTPRPGQSVNAHFVGRLLDGTDFVEQGPFDFILVKERLNRGLFEGFQEMRAGGKIRLYVSPALTEGTEEKLGIPPGTAVAYEIELFEIKETRAQDLADSLLPPSPEPPPPPLAEISGEKLLALWGWSLGQQSGATRYDLSPSEQAAFIRGLSEGIREQPLPFLSDSMASLVQQMVAERREKSARKIKEMRRAQMEEFFSTLKKNPKVRALPDGLRYEVIKQGKGPYPRPGDIVIVNYTARLLDGTVFDRTENEPLHIEVGSVIPGFNEGIQKINPGGELKLYLPPSLAYGDENASGVLSNIPGGSVVLYEIKLLRLERASATK